MKAGAESQRRCGSLGSNAERREKRDDVVFEFAANFFVDDQHRVIQLVLCFPSVKEYVISLEVCQKLIHRVSARNISFSREKKEFGHESLSGERVKLRS